jgi:hypothetical protein
MVAVLETEEQERELETRAQRGVTGQNFTLPCEMF